MLRTRWAAVGAAVAITLGAGGLGVAQATVGTGDDPVTITVEPARILDTRAGLGLLGRFDDAVPRQLEVTGEVPVAPSGTDTVVPPDAIGVLVNVTVVAPSSKGFLTLRPGGSTGTPTTSTVNFEAGVNTPNAATVDLAADGTVQIWVDTDAVGGSAHVLLDVVGYTVDHDHDDRYYTETEIDAGFVAHGEIEMGYGHDFHQEFSVDNGLDSSRFSANATGYLYLEGPTRLGTVDYGLKSVRYCIEFVSGGAFVSQIYVAWQGPDAGDGNEQNDPTDRTTAGCYTTAVGNAVATSFVLEIQTNGPPGSYLRINNVTAVWAPAASL